MMMKDSGRITDLQKLPISSISYGPMPIEGQSANVTIGPLTCQPEENNYDAKEHLQTIEEKIEANFANHDSKIENVEENLNLTIENLANNENYASREEFELLESKVTEMKKSINECYSNPCQSSSSCEDLENG